MTPERWQRIKDVFSAALEASPEKRPALLEKGCDGDPELLQDVERLLVAHDKSTPFLLDTNRARGERDSGSSAGIAHRRIGPYEVLRDLGRGGMGAVYLAERADGAYRTQVAIKLVPRELATAELVERFRNERQILAALAHPNIARLLDGGTTDDGIPYLVMEYVNGVAIDRYCDAHALGVPERLSLFRPVCAAVHFAHQNLTVHRDIKPANVLVTEDGTPMLLDFGIAKLLTPGLPASGKTATGFMMTPEYASPEQVRNEPLSTASDVYSLGVLLYRLLTGQLPYRISGDSLLDVIEAVRDQEPVRPSAVVRRLRGDLDNIVLRAMRKDPRERYASAEELSADIGRHLSGHAVLARPPTARYRVGKFVRRHKAGVAAAALLVSALVSAVVVTLRAARTARMERARAERRFDDVRALTGAFLFDFHDAIKDLPGSTAARKLVVQTALKYLDRIAVDSDAAADASLVRDLATAYERLGEVQGHYLASNLGENSNALSSYRKAVELWTQLGNLSNATVQDRVSLAEAHRRLAAQLAAAGDRVQALARAHRATEMSQALEQRAPRDLSVLHELSSDHALLGQLADDTYSADTPDYAGALEQYQSAVALDRRMLDLDPAGLPALRSLASDLEKVGSTRTSLGQFAGASDTLREALAMHSSIAARTGAVRDRRYVAVMHNRLAGLYATMGDYHRCLVQNAEGLEIYKKLFSEEPRNALLRQGLAIAYSNVGDAQSKLNLVADAGASLQEAVATMSPLSGPEANAMQRQIFAQMQLALGKHFSRAGQLGPAIDAFKAALAILGDTAGTRTARADGEIGLADAQLRSGRAADAAAGFTHALALAQTPATGDMEGLRNLASAYAGLGNVEFDAASRAEGGRRRPHLEHAAAYYRQSIEAWERIPAASRAAQARDAPPSAGLDVVARRMRAVRDEAQMQPR